MIKFGFKRPVGFNQLGQTQVKRLKDLILSDLEAGLRAMQESIMLTPVYTGRTLVNYRWSLGSAVTETRTPISQPDKPGKTSEMKLGGEPRRAANASIVQTEFNAMMAELRQSRNPFVGIYLTNNTPYFDQVEYGTYSTSEGASARTPPGGMVRRGETILEATILGLSRTSGGV